ncbi:MAG TPA: VWA domain-containing protein [Thermoanaerobaculia bacterium]|jgi:VWFA-related protein|nr:VWA domain-containing protein [Thermoanaerobaculia bacterium]
MPRKVHVSAFLVSFLLLPVIVNAVEPAWLDEVAPLIGAAERETFLRLSDPAQQDEFVQRFWQVRDPYPQTERNELQESWAGRLAEARQRWGDLQDDRARALLLRGEPSSTFEASCPDPVEVWTYEPGFGAKYRMALVFLQGRLWQPGPDAPDLRPAAPESCENGRRLTQEMKWIGATGAEQYRAMIEKAFARPRPEPRDWYTRFASEPVSEPAGMDESLRAGLEVDYPDRYEDNRVVRVLMTVPSDSFIHPAPVTGERELLVTGQVVGGLGVLDDFRYSFQVDPRVDSQPFIPLVFERYLRPGLYRLRVKLVDLFTKRFFQEERELTVPELAELPTEAIATVPEVHLVPPGSGPLSGETRFEARVDGPVRKVAFLLDGRSVYTRTRPPYEVTLDLGSAPKLQKLAVQGIDDQGQVIARDELVLNSGSQRFSIRLLEPRPGQAVQGSLRARVQAETPPGEKVERVELWLNDNRVATLYQPPYAQPIQLPQGQELGFVRAVAYLRDGRSAEDTVLLNTPDQPDEMAVRLVDFFATVMDGAGRPVQSVSPGLFSVLEDGVPQRLRVIEPAGETPIRVVTLIDNSMSMRDNLAKTRAAALGFLKRTLRPTDQAAVITFNRAPRVAVRLTNDLEELEEGFTGLLAEDQTSLYDSIAYALQYLGGVKGQRAVLLLSDGMDRTSRLSYDQTLEVARRAGIAVYAIGLNLDEGGSGEAGKKLSRIAAETGGRSWFVSGTADLDGVYTQIERELRSQYHLAYQSTNNSPDTGFRAVKVQLAEKGLEARTISGYYP